MPGTEEKIELPESGGQMDLKDPPMGGKEAKERFKSIDLIIYTVIIAIVISSISSLVAVGAIVIDQLHFNNQTYRDYSNFNKQFIDQELQIQQLQRDLGKISTSSTAK